MGGSYGKMGNDTSQWGPHHAAPMNMMQGPNGQMGGPPINMPIGAPNMMPGYQGWGTSPQQQGYGYGNSGPGSYQGWGAPPGPQGPPPHQWSNYGGPQQTQGYGGYDMYNSASTTGPNGPSGGASWNSWNMPPNSGGPAGAAAAGGGSGNDMYSRAQTWGGAGGPSGAGPVGGMPRTGPGNSASKSGSEYDYGGYGSSGYDYDYTTYSKEQQPGSTYAGPRSAYSNDTTSQPPYPASQAV